MFDRAFEFTHEWEGGDSLTNDPHDPGGITRHGISLRFLQTLPIEKADINGDGSITSRDIEALTLDKAVALYREFFWDAMMLEEMPPTLAFVMFDTGVNVGRGRAVKWLQQCFSSELKVDGIVGPRTIRILRHRLSLDYSILEMVVQLVLLRRRYHYAKLAARNSWARRFLNGWLNRTDALEMTVSSICKEDREEGGLPT